MGTTRIFVSHSSPAEAQQDGNHYNNSLQTFKQQASTSSQTITIEQRRVFGSISDRGIVSMPVAHLISNTRGSLRRMHK